MMVLGWGRAGIELILNSKVQSVRKNVVCVSNADGSMREIPFGACVWATGVAMHPLVRQLKVRFNCPFLVQAVNTKCTT